MRKIVAVAIGGVLWAVVTATVVVIGSDCRHSPKEDDCPEDWVNSDLAFVIVASEDMPAGTELTPLLGGNGPFIEIQIPIDTLLEGAVIRVEQLEGMLTTKPIRAN